MIIPIKDENPTRIFPFVTILIIIINVVIFFVELQEGSNLETFVKSFGCIPYEITTGIDITPYIHFPVRFTIITSMFLHGGWMHLIGNMFYLWIFGNNIEDKLGHMRYLIFYFVVGIIASLSQTMISPISKIPQIGASGAISGILGAYLLLFPRAKVLLLLYFISIVKVPAYIFLGLWILLQVFNAFSTLSYAAHGGVAFFAHVGGFIAGFSLIKVFLIGRRYQRW